MSFIKGIIDSLGSILSSSYETEQNPTSSTMDGVAGASSITNERVAYKLKGYFDLAKEEIAKAVRAEEWVLVDDAIVHYKNAQRILNEACSTPVPSYITSSEQEKVKSYRQKISKWQSQVSERLQALNRRAGGTSTSKWFGDAEKLTKALFSFAGKLAPVIIFVDEVDSLLGARGGAFEHEATRRMRNEFMAAWDGLRSKESQRILILGATNRPFDLDDAVIRRLPRRIYVDLPDAENRMKILKIFLAQENIEPDFQYHELANATEGYSGSDLKNLCIAAAYRPVQELLEKEKQGVKSNPSLVLRPLNVEDFIQSKSTVGPSVAYDASSMNELRKWNEQYGEGGSRRKTPFGF